MKTIPIRRYKRPAYPTKLEILDHPDLLRQRMPPAWRGVPEMAGAVALFMVANAAGFKNEAKAGDSTKAGALVAPIFEHGTGRGATGCIVMSPPVFLSEEEALQVICEELVKHDVQLTQTNRPISGVTIPRRYQVTETHLYGSRAPDWLLKLNRKHQLIPSSEFKRVRRTVVDRKNGVPLLADRSDPRKNIAMEFISTEDERKVRSTAGLKLRSFTLSSVSSHNLKGISESLVHELEKSGKEQIRFGTFYDPCVRLEVRETPGQAEEMRNASKEERSIMHRKLYQETRDSAKAESRRLLRQQVLDFVNWLKGQGAI